MTRRTLTAGDFRAMILETLPELSPQILGAEPGGAHRDASVVRQFAIDAIRAGDLGRTERVFRLARRLAAVSDRLDYYSENALWTCFLSGFEPHAAAGLALFRRISPEVRATLYCPFTIPHTWFETEVIEVPRWAGCGCTVAAEAQERVRYVRQSSEPGHFADVTLRVSPRDADEGVVFVNGVPPDRRLPIEVVEAVRDEVLQSLVTMGDAGQCLRAVTITLVDAAYHPVDTRTSDVRRVTGNALRRALETAGVVRA